MCVVCNNDIEDEMYMFMHCTFAINCWKEANLRGEIEQYTTTSGSFSSIIFTIFAALDEETRARFSAILWSIWRSRNACLWEQKFANVMATCSLASDTVRDYMWCHRINEGAHTPPTVSAWTKPQYDWLKCNVDCTIFASEGKCGACIGFRDSFGHLTQAHSLTFPFVATVAECEGTDLQQALQIAIDRGFDQVIFESDCQTIVNAVNNNILYENELGSLLSNCRTLLSSNAIYALAYIRRQTNRVAHNLARVSILQASPSTFYYPPDCISSIILDEMK